MPAAVPKYVGDDFSQCPPGHWYRLYWPGWDDSWQSEQSLDHARKLAMPDDSKKLADALRQRHRHLAWSLGAEIIPVRLTSALTTGMGIEHPNENGFAFLDPYGLPYVPGSSIKGVVRRAAEELALFDDQSPWSIVWVWLLFGFDGSAAYLAAPQFKKNTPQHVREATNAEAAVWQKAYQGHVQTLSEADIVALRAVCEPDYCNVLSPQWLAGLAGKQPKDIPRFISVRGALDWWDCVAANIGADVMTPHFPDFHAKGKKPATDDQGPEPHGFLVIPPGETLDVVVALGHDAALPDDLRETWRRHAQDAVRVAFAKIGAGAKTSQGYGTGEVDDKEIARRERKIAQARAEAERQEQERRRREAAAALERDLEAKGVSAAIAATIAALEQTDDENVINNAYKQFDNAQESHERRALATALRAAYERIGKWGGKQSKKQKAKIETILAALEDEQ